jgi:hypothetical protein
MMMAVDETAARQLICEVQRDELSVAGGGLPRTRIACDVSVPDADTDADTPSNAVSNMEPRDELGRRKRR